ncbi:MAG: peptidoglycan DD-metalloendopeptidase family protein [Gammaproteobacteria bacterium]|nr:peptidoglycan DD-metalloendopeptidase family protein [Gammaproteobacteria bacterium]
MTRSGRRPPAFALLILVFSLLFSTNGYPAKQKAKKAELSKLRTLISELRVDLDKVRSSYDQLRTELGVAERKIGKLSNSLEKLSKSLKKKQKSLKSLKKKRDSLQQAVSGQRGHLANQVRAAYAMGNQGPIKILLNQEEPAAVGRVMVYYDYLNRARTDQITILLESLEALEKVKRGIDTETKQLEKLRSRRLSEKDALEEKYRQRGTLIAKIGVELKSKDQHLQAMLKDEKELARLLGVLAEALEDIPAESGESQAFSSLKGKLKWPTKGKLLERFGSKRRVGKLRWQGVMIKAKEGDNVRAVSHGRVAFADWLRGYGLLIIIDHGDGYMSLYGHNQSLYKETGDWVEVGDAIAIVGESGGQQKTALYFEIRHRGKPVNPEKWCRKYAG